MRPLAHECRHTPEARRLLRNAGIPIVETGDLTDRPLDMVVSYSNFEASRAMTASIWQRRHPYAVRPNTPGASSAAS